MFRNTRKYCMLTNKNLTNKHFLRINLPNSLKSPIGFSSIEKGDAVYHSFISEMCPQIELSSKTKEGFLCCIILFIPNVRRSLRLFF